MKKIVILLVAACLLLTACMSPVPDPTGQTTTAPGSVYVPSDPTTVPTDSTTVPTDPTTVPTDPTTVPTDPTTAPTDPAPTTEPRDPELEAIMELFNYLSSERSPYFWATGYEYASPVEIKLRNFFDHGFPGEHEKTADEYEELKKLVNYIEWLDNADFNRLPKDKMEADLKAVYGISLADLPDSAYEGLYYLESTDCYYMLQTAPNSSAINLPFLSAERNEDETVSLTYENSMGNFIITLKPNGDSYLVLSNVKAE